VSVETFQSSEQNSDREERIRGVEVAARAIVRIRLLIEGHRGRLDLEHNEEVVDQGMIKHLTDAIKELEGELEDALVFLEEFDPVLFQKLKDNS
jgi:hypothetical protein